MISVLVLVLTTGLGASGQDLPALDVRIVDVLGGPVPRARVTVSARAVAPSRTAVTNDAGVARVAPLPAGDYLIEVEAQGFARPAVTAVRIAAAQRHDVTIALALAGFSDVVVVTASGTAQNVDQISKSASVLTRGDMDDRGDRTIAEAVRAMAGVRVQQLGGPGAATSVNIRGLRSEDTAVLIDGVRFRDPGATQGDAGPFVSDLLITNPDRIEVLRGSGSSLYGSHAIGGVLNVITRPGTGPPAGGLLVEAGGLGTWRTRGHVGGGAWANRIGYSVGATRLDVADGVDADDAADNTNVQGELGVVLGNRARLSARFYGANASTMVNEGPSAVGSLPPSGVVDARPLSIAELARYEAGAPVDALDLGDATFIPSANDPDNRRASRFRSTHLVLSHQPGHRVGYRLFFHDVTTSRRFDDGPLGVSGFEPVGPTQSTFGGRIGTLGARADVQVGPRHLVTLGYEFERERYSSDAAATTRNAASTVEVIQRSQTLFIQDQFSVARDLQVSGAVRAQHFSLGTPRLTPADRPPFQGVRFEAPPAAFTADVSAVYAGLGPRTRLRAHAGTGYRAPSLFERFGTSFGRRGYSIFGDPRLGPEGALTLDVGADRDLASGSVRLSATVFGTWLDDVIVFDFSGAIDPATDPFGRSSGYRTATGATSRGAELQLAATPSANTRVDAAYTFVAAEPRTAGPVELTRAAAIPRHQASVVVSHRFNQRVHVTVDVLAASAHLGTLPDPVTFAARVFRFAGARHANLAAAYAHPLNSRTRVKLFGRVDNLFGAVRHESGFRTPGRYVTAGVAIEF
ncbi:MAG: TonB-dependent receptor [Acidobacteria bacterium]|nr:TonB-dependent receptor [Acidobacteriota bacterium]